MKSRSNALIHELRNNYILVTQSTGVCINYVAV